jgi:hypothetical protein
MNKKIALNVIELAHSQMSARTKGLVCFPAIKEHIRQGFAINDIIDIFTKSMSEKVDSVADIILLQESLWIVKVFNDFKCGDYTMLERFVLNQYDPSLKPNALTVHAIRHP